MATCHKTGRRTILWIVQHCHALSSLILRLLAHQRDGSQADHTCATCPGVDTTIWPMRRKMSRCTAAESVARDDTLMSALHFDATAAASSRTCIDFSLFSRQRKYHAVLQSL